MDGCCVTRCLFFRSFTLSFTLFTFCSNFLNKIRLKKGANCKEFESNHLAFSQLLLSSTSSIFVSLFQFSPSVFLHINRCLSISSLPGSYQGTFEHCFLCDNQVSASADSLLDLHQASIQTQRGRKERQAGVDLINLHLACRDGS